MHRKRLWNVSKTRHYPERSGSNMNKRFVDIEYMREKLEEESLNVKTGIRAGAEDPPVYVCYGVEPPPDDGPIYA
jgi:hypothetical protein